jgi:hypothetical protein
MPRTKCTTCGRICWTCRRCHNRTFCEFCNTCNLHGQDEPAPDMIRNPADRSGRRKRQWVVRVAFFTRRGWSGTFEVRVQAKGLAGAIWHGVRQARRENLTPRTRVSQARVTAVAA